MRFYSFLAIASLFFSCKTIQVSDKIEFNESADVREEIVMEDPQVVFLYFKIEKITTEDIQIRLHQIQVVDGKMKENTIRQAPKTDGNLIVQLLDENSHIQVEQIIENPLNLVLEQYSETREINMNQLELESGQFFIRFNHNKTIQALKVYSIHARSLIEVYHNPLQL